ncbi:MAG: ABC transporter permease subunit [Pseudomonadota bacterium]|nr:ABC transporter permease subunit [Pseudomonadota bacterium]
MRDVWTLWKKELRIYFVSPLAYVFLSAFLFLAGLFFYLGVTLTGEASLRVLLGNLAITQLFVLPMLTMRHFAEERRQGTLELLMTAPVSLGAIVVGKWLASLTLCLLMFLGTLVFPAVLAYYGDPDWGVMFTSYLGLVCVASAFCAAGLFASSLTDDQVAAGLIGIVLLLPFWLVGRAEALLPEEWADVVRPLSVLVHLDSFNRGVLDSADLFYFLAFTGVFLFLTFRSVESRRWR